MDQGISVRDWSYDIIGAAMEVHRHLGPGLLESVYEKCLIHECGIRAIPVCRQVMVGVSYKGLCLDDGFRADLIVPNEIVVELKAVDAVLPIHKAQLYSYMRLMDIPVGLLINFHEPVLKDGIHRLFLKNMPTTSLPSFPSVQ